MYYHRTPKSRLSTPSCASWLRAACFPRNISVLEVFLEIHLGTMDLLVLFTPTLQVPYEDTRVRLINCTYFPRILISHVVDVLAHRQLAAAIQHTPLHASLHSKQHIERILDTVNRRHRMAQMASRASVEFYVGLALQARGQRLGQGLEVEEDAFVIRAFRNGLSVFVSRSAPLCHCCVSH